MGACDDGNCVQLQVVDSADGGEQVLFACVFSRLCEQPQSSQHKALSLGLGEDRDFEHGVYCIAGGDEMIVRSRLHTSSQGTGTDRSSKANSGLSWSPLQSSRSCRRHYVVPQHQRCVWADRARVLTEGLNYEKKLSIFQCS